MKQWFLDHTVTCACVFIHSGWTWRCCRGTLGGSWRLQTCWRVIISEYNLCFLVNVSLCLVCNLITGYWSWGKIIWDNEVDCNKSYTMATNKNCFYSVFNIRYSFYGVCISPCSQNVIVLILSFCPVCHFNYWLFEQFASWEVHKSIVSALISVR